MENPSARTSPSVITNVLACAAQGLFQLYVRKLPSILQISQKCTCSTHINRYASGMTCVDLGQRGILGAFHLQMEVVPLVKAVVYLVGQKQSFWIVAIIALDCPI